MRKLLVLIIILIGILLAWNGVQKYAPSKISLPNSTEKVKIVSEEYVIIDVVKKVKPSVVTVSEELPQQSFSPFELGPFGIFGVPEEAPGPQNIGSGFIVSKDGLIVTNKHVVSDTGGKYQVITSDDKKYDVVKIYRDPLNDVAILKVNPSQNSGSSLVPIMLGDSSNLQVGQLVVAIGTPLGEFNNSATSGIISGLGRGISAGSPLQGVVERLDNVVQTDAAINPGNSGGPLVNSSGQVIGVNTAIASSGQNIGFALPINVIKDSLKNFNETGQFERAFLGVSYTMIDRDTSVQTGFPEGAYIQQVVKNSPADKGGLMRRDIVTKIDGGQLESRKNELSSVIARKKVGDTITLSVWRKETGQNAKTLDIKVKLGSAPNQ